MLVQTNRLRDAAYASVKAATTALTSASTTVRKLASPTDTLERTHNSHAYADYSPLKPPRPVGIAVRKSLETSGDRALREHPECFAFDDGAGGSRMPRSVHELDASMRCADGPYLEKAYVAGSIIAGAIEGVTGLPSRPMPGYEREFYTARKTAAIESVGVAIVTGGATLMRGGSSTVTALRGGTAALAVDVPLASSVAVGVGAVRAPSALTDTPHVEAPLESRSHKDSRDLKERVTALDAKGRVHGAKLPTRSDLQKLSTEDLRALRSDYQTSIKNRIEGNATLGPKGNHGLRQNQEQDVLNTIERLLAEREKCEPDHPLRRTQQEAPM